MAVYQDKAKERIKKGLRKFSAITNNARSNGINESDTRLIITAILTDVLGWSAFDDITSEQCIKGQYCDYALKYDGSIFAIVEAKAIGFELSHKHVYQAVSYAANEGVDWVILTNGSRWQVYRVVFGKPVTQDLVFEVSMVDETTTASDRTELFYLMSKEARRAEELEAYQAKKSALCGANVAKALLDEGMLDRLRREMKSKYGQNASLQELAAILVEDVFRPDVQDDEVTRLIRRAATAQKKNPRTKRSPVSARSSLDPSASKNASEKGSIVDALRASSAPLNRAEILSATKINEAAWGATIRELVESGIVIQDGVKRGARYRLPEVDVQTPPEPAPESTTF